MKSMLFLILLLASEGIQTHDINFTTLTVNIKENIPYTILAEEAKVEVSDPSLNKIWDTKLTSKNSTELEVPMNRWLVLTIEKPGYNKFETSIKVDEPNSSITVKLKVNLFKFKWLYITIGAAVIFLYLMSKSNKLKTPQLRKK